MPGGLSTQQIENARTAWLAVLQVGLEKRLTAQQIEDMAVSQFAVQMAESSFLRYANDGSYANPDQRDSIYLWYGRTYGPDPNLRDPAKGQPYFREHMRLTLNYPYDKVAGSAQTTKDSVGGHQQREMYGYFDQVPKGADRMRVGMDLTETTKIYCRGVPQRPLTPRNWLHPSNPWWANPRTVDVAQASQWVQGSEFPTGDNYRPHVPLAQELVAYFGGVVRPDEPTDLDLPDDTLALLLKGAAAADWVQRRLAEIPGDLGNLGSTNSTVADIQRRVAGIEHRLGSL